MTQAGPFLPLGLMWPLSRTSWARSPVLISLHVVGLGLPRPQRVYKAGRSSKASRDVVRAWVARTEKSRLPLQQAEGQQPSREARSGGLRCHVGEAGGQAV